MTRTSTEECLKFLSILGSIPWYKEVAQKIESLSVPKGFAVCPVLIHTSSLTDDLLDTQFFFKAIDLNEVLGEIAK